MTKKRFLAALELLNITIKTTREIHYYADSVPGLLGTALGLWTTLPDSTHECEEKYIELLNSDKNITEFFVAMFSLYVHLAEPRYSSDNQCLAKSISNLAVHTFVDAGYRWAVNSDFIRISISTVQSMEWKWADAVEEKKVRTISDKCPSCKVEGIFRLMAFVCPSCNKLLGGC